MEAKYVEKPKLRPFAAFRYLFSAEIYVKQALSRCRRSFLVQLRLGNLPLEINASNELMQVETCQL